MDHTHTANNNCQLHLPLCVCMSRMEARCTTSTECQRLAGKLT
jgi:hypothetical protein